MKPALCCAFTDVVLPAGQQASGILASKEIDIADNRASGDLLEGMTEIVFAESDGRTDLIHGEVLGIMAAEESNCGFYHLYPIVWTFPGGIAVFRGIMAVQMDV